MNERATPVMRLLEFTDSAFPVGTFSFSEGLETAAETGLVHDAATLGDYARDIARRSAFTDGVAALCAFRAAVKGDYRTIAEADERVWLCRLNAESRTMTCRMGRKAAELADRIMGDDNGLWNDIGRRRLADMAAGRLRGTYPVTQATVFAACGLSEYDLFCALLYGALNMVLSAALRCVRVSHYDTQRILFDASADAGALFDEASAMTLDEMNAFTPQADILASLHEKGSKRMFMN